MKNISPIDKGFFRFLSILFIWSMFGILLFDWKFEKAQNKDPFIKFKYKKDF